MFTFPALPALLLLILACLTAGVLAFLPDLGESDDDTAPRRRRPSHALCRAFAPRVTESLLSGRDEARPDPPRKRPGGHGLSRARWRRSDRSGSG